MIYCCCVGTSGAFSSFMQCLSVRKRKCAFNILSVERQAGTPTRKEDGEINSGFNHLWRILEVSYFPEHNPTKKESYSSISVISVSFFSCEGKAGKAGSWMKNWGISL